MSGTASDVGGIVSATRSRKTVSESRIVTPVNHVTSTSYNRRAYEILMHEFKINYKNRLELYL